VGRSVQQTRDGGSIVVGSTVSFGNGMQIYIIKTDFYGNVGISEKGYSGDFILMSFLVRPNPFYYYAKVIGYEQERIILYDITGRHAGNYYGGKVGFDLPPGIYFIQPENKSIKPVKIIKLK
jgi:hypothetical protein